MRGEGVEVAVPHCSVESPWGIPSTSGMLNLSFRLPELSLFFMQRSVSEEGKQPEMMNLP